MDGIYFILLISLTRLLDLYNFILLIYALFSWFPGAYETFVGRVICSLVDPIIAPLRKLNFRVAGLDFTLFLLMVCINFLSDFIYSFILR